MKFGGWYGVEKREGDVAFVDYRARWQVEKCGGGTGNDKKRKRKGGLGGGTLSMQQTECKRSMRIRNVR